MKKVFNLFAVIIFVLCVGVACFGCAPTDDGNNDAPPTVYPNYTENLFSNATVKDSGGEVITVFKGVKGNFIDVNFDSPKALNTIVLKEKTKNVSAFEISYKNGDDYTFLYKQDVIEKYRYCSFDRITTSSIRISVTDTKEDAEWRLSDIEMYNMGGTYTKDFTVTAYIVCSNVYKAEKVSEKSLAVITDINLISATYFNKLGQIQFKDEVIDGVSVNGKTIFETALKNVRDKMADGAKIVVTFLGQDIAGTGDSTHDISLTAFTTNKQTLITNLKNFADEYQLDGISFDWEHPIDRDEYNAFFEFCGALKQSLNGKTVTAALADWAVYNIGLINYSLLGNLDQIELMSYDNFDANGNHSSFYGGCYEPLQKITANSKIDSLYTDLAKIDLGLPFYSRPASGAAYWGNYNQHAEALGKYGNSVYSNETLNGVEVGALYYNSYQMIYDKTAYCLDNNIGGVMVWHYSCDVAFDNELSLWKAISDAISSRK